MHHDKSVDRVTEILSGGRIEMSVLAATKPHDYVECREITAALWPALASMCEAVSELLMDLRDIADATSDA